MILTFKGLASLCTGIRSRRNPRLFNDWLLFHLITESQRTYSIRDSFPTSSCGKGTCLGVTFLMFGRTLLEVEFADSGPDRAQSRFGQGTHNLAFWPA